MNPNDLKVNDLREVKKVPFSSLPSGQVFEHGGVVYMKLRFLYRVDSTDTYNCIIIANNTTSDKKPGYYKNFYPEDIITLSKFTLVIE
jgi:hypothetical protein